MTEPASSAPDRLDWYQSMVRIRLFEEKVQELFMTGQIQGTTHLCQGQEAVSVGAIAAMRPGRRPDQHVPRPRRGARARHGRPRRPSRSSWAARPGGSGGVGGSMHLIDFSKGNIGANAIVGAGLPIAVGAAVAFQMQRKPNVALSFFGDGATNIGTFHEALNMAAVWNAPVVFIITNNLYGEYSPLRATTPIDDLARRADPFGFPGIDRRRPGHRCGLRGDDEAVERARGRRGADPARDEDLPLPRPLPLGSGQVPARRRARALEGSATRSTSWAQRLIAEGVIGPNDPTEIRNETQADIDAAAERAATSPYPTLEETRPVCLR